MSLKRKAGGKTGGLVGSAPELRGFKRGTAKTKTL